MATHDVIVIGGGINGLVAACVLAGQKRDVIVLERRDVLGGIAATRVFHPGYSVPGLLHDTHGLRESVIEACGLWKHGLTLHPRRPFLAAEPDGHGMLVHADTSERDTEAYARFQAFLARIRGGLAALVDAPAPSLGDPLRKLVWPAFKTGRALRRLGRRDMMELLRIPSMCAADWLNDWFDDELLKAGLAQPALLGTWAGPWAAGTAANLLFDLAFAGREVLGGPAALVESLVGACRERGVTLRSGATVASLLVRENRVHGVGLGNGEELIAPAVLSCADPKHTLLDLVPIVHRPPDLVREIRNLRARGTLAKVHLALDAAPKFGDREPGSVDRIRTGTTLDDLERAFDAIKYGGWSDPPLLDINLVSLSDPGLAPRGHHVASILVHFAPANLKAGWTAPTKDALTRAVIEEFNRHAPGIADHIVAREILTPDDLAAEYALPTGHPFHGEHALDQLLSMRPTPACAQHNTPISGLYLGSAGTHPGGFSPGLPGLMAAARI